MKGRFLFQLVLAVTLYLFSKPLSFPDSGFFIYKKEKGASVMKNMNYKKVTRSPEAVRFLFDAIGGSPPEGGHRKAHAMFLDSALLEVGNG